MLVGEKKITFEEYMAMPEGAPYQYISGCLISWPSRTTIHQVTLMNVMMDFHRWEEKSKSKGILIPGPIEVILDEQNSFQPDFIYIAEDRSDIVKDYVYGPPDLVVEVLWEKNAYYDLRPKKDIYEKYGVKEYIIIDPIAKNADLYVLKDGIYYLHQKAENNDSLNSVLLSGFNIELSKLFQ